jgi:uncharacterized membrane protein HdeD (DUF308 family)
MEKLFKRTGYLSLLSSVLYFILALLLINHPTGVLKIVVYLIGTFFILIGIYKIISYFIYKSNYMFYDYNLFYGIFAILLGILVFIYNGVVAGLLGIIFGIWIIISGLHALRFSLRLKNLDVHPYIYSLLASILILVCGIYIVVAPSVAVITLGLVLLIYSILDIFENLIFIANLNKIIKMK